MSAARRSAQTVRAKRKIGSPMLSNEEKTPIRKRRFSVLLDVEIEVNECLLTDVLTDEWRGHFYPLNSPGEVAAHLAYNLIQGRRLSSLDGFADQPEDATRIVDVAVDETHGLPRHERAGGALQSQEGRNGPEYNWRCTCDAIGETWRSTRRGAESDYQQHLGAETKAGDATKAKKK